MMQKMASNMSSYKWKILDLWLIALALILLSSQYLTVATCASSNKAGGYLTESKLIPVPSRRYYADWLMKDQQ